MDEQDDSRQYLSLQADFVAKLTDLVGEKLKEYDVFYSPADAVPSIVTWLVSTAEEHGQKLDDFISENDRDAALDDIVDSITQMLMLQIAEERPGSDPWDFNKTIPIPVSVALLMNHVLILCANLAYGNNADAWALNAVNSSGSLTACLAEQFIRSEQENVDMVVITRDGEKLVAGPVVLIPQPALAYLARFFESAALRVEKKLWNVDEEEVPLEEVYENIRQQARVARFLCLKYGVSPGPKADS